MIGTVEIIIGIFVLGLLVIIHELGHFLVAKACGIRVLSFSIGFGKVIFRKRVNGTEYRVSAIPFGGYVHMKGEHPEDDHEQSDDDFSSKPVWQRGAVALAGPVANLVSSIIILWVIFMVGIDRVEDMTVGLVVDNSAAAQTDVRPGDSLISVNNNKVKSWQDFYQSFLFQDDEYSIEYIRNGVRKTALVKNVKIDEKSMDVQSAVGIIPTSPAKIGQVTPPDFPGAQLGFKPDDIVVKVDSVDIGSWYAFSEIVSNYTPEAGPLTITIRRGDAVKQITATPVFDEKYDRYRLGMVMAKPDEIIIRYSPIEAIPRALERTWEYTTMIFRILPKIFSMRKQLAGPVGIMQMSGKVALISFVGLLNFIALIGINLGVLNLLPLIITDGGVIFFLIIESIRKKPLSLKAQLVLNKIAIAFFIVLFVYVTKNDILRFFTQ